MTAKLDDSTTTKDARLKRFVDEYLVGLNGVRAFLAAFGREMPNGKRRSYASARVEASKMLKRQDVRREIRAAQQAIRRRARISAERVVREIAAVAFSDIGDFLDYACEGLPAPKNGRDVPFLARKALKKIKVKTRRVRSRGGDKNAVEEVEDVEIELHDKLQALDRLAKHLGLFREVAPLVELLRQLPADLRVQVAAAMGLDPAIPRKSTRPATPVGPIAFPRGTDPDRCE